MDRIQCVMCRRVASKYYVTLDSTLWAVCQDHRGPFLKCAVEVDPSDYEIEEFIEDDEFEDY